MDGRRASPGSGASPGGPRPETAPSDARGEALRALESTVESTLGDALASASELGLPVLQGRGAPRHYLALLRVDHWSKNVLVVAGMLLALFYQPGAWGDLRLGHAALALLAVCLVASSNYVINELLDARHDRLHPKKGARPAAQGLVDPRVCVALWLAVGALGLGLSALVGEVFATWAAALWLMGVVYNVPPLRSKEVAYLDVLSESVNAPLRLLMGWSVLLPALLPPVSLLVAFWMAGSYYMATKRFAEYRRIADPGVAAAYRASFRRYDEGRLLVSMLFYVTACAFFGGIFIVRYKLELILCVPVLAGFFAHSLALALRHDSLAQTPERLASDRGTLGFGLATAAAFVVAMLVDVPALYELFNVEASSIEPLWRIGT